MLYSHAYIIGNTSLSGFDIRTSITIIVHSIFILICILIKIQKVHEICFFLCWTLFQIWMQTFVDMFLHRCVILTMRIQEISCCKKMWRSYFLWHLCNKKKQFIVICNKISPFLHCVYEINTPFRLVVSLEADNVVYKS